MNVAIVLSFLVFSASAWAVEPVNEKNWRTHPEIKKIGSLLADINEAKDQENYSTEGNSCSEGDTTINLTLDTDEKDKVVKYAISTSGNGEDGVDEFYFDNNEILRFAYHSRGENLATQVESRQYFDRKGNLIYTRKSPDHGDAESSTSVIKNPRSDYATRCKGEDDEEDSSESD